MEDSLKWQAPEYRHYQRSTDWFWAVGIITVCISILAFIFDNALFGILILLSAGILVFYVLHVPEDVDYEINKKGIVIGKELHPYLTIEAFWLETDNNIESKIILKSKKSFLPYIIIPVHNDSADEVASVLRNFLEEKELSEPMAHKVMEYLGF
jgi:hypothetical protein